MVTVSAGVATMFPDNGASRRALVEAADKALYQAKSEGRNRVALGSCTSTEHTLQLQHQVLDLLTVYGGHQTNIGISP